MHGTSIYLPTFFLLLFYLVSFSFLHPLSPSLIVLIPPLPRSSPLSPSLLHFLSPGLWPVPSISNPIPLLSSSLSSTLPFRCNSTASALWPCPHHGHSGLPDGSSVCLPPAHTESCWVGGHAVPLGQDVHRLVTFLHLRLSQPLVEDI